ncbi:VOC family protein [Tsuneonella amylolytica]|uniref:VOC family protein n=1 Tax=Tsuneonella amylolytica TaxID=2338327 RepID=UPI000EA86692|nr:VOC family protein [Tsuneonella amylolytica]
MTQTIFVNLPVADLARSKAFYEAIGFENDPRYTNDVAAAVFLSEAIYVMLLTHDFWKTFTSKAIPDAKASAQLMLAISREDRGAVDAMVEAAAAAGGTPDCNPRQDHGFMYGRSFEDPDGHIWEPSWMDPAVLEKGPQAHAEAQDG